MNKNLVGLLVVGMLSQLATGILGPVYALLYQKIGDFSTTSISFGIFSLTLAILETPLGHLSDKYGRKKFIILGGILASIVSISYTFINSPMQLYALEVLAGAATAMQTPVLYSMLSETFPKNKKGKFFGLFDSSINMTYGLASIVAGLLFSIFGLEFLFILSSTIHAFSAAVAYKLKC
ncbi:MAG: MFS transporter [Candidatus Aenigmatarchaeota archaeon]